MNIVSFYAPRPEHPFFQDYRPFLNLLRLSCARFGHTHLVLTDDPMEVGDGDAYSVDLPRPLMKAVLAAQLAYLSDPAMADVPTLLVGADCVLARDPDLVFIDGDIGITVGEFADCRMNTGAIYIPRPSVVAPIWAEALAHAGEDWGDDQTALYLAICIAASQRGLRVYELPVDPYNLAPEHPGDDCRRGVVLHFRGPRKAWMVNYCHHWLGLGQGYVAVALPNTSEDEVISRMRAAVERRLPEIAPQEAHDGHAVLVGGGPSLAGDLDEIRRRALDGQTIFALNGAAHYLIQKGIQPDYCVLLDARPENVRFVTPHHDCSYLLASQCHADVFDALPRRKIQVWHCAVQAGDVLPPVDPPHHYVMGNVTVGLTAMSLVFMMGYRKLHLYGYDSSDALEGDMHAYEQTQGRAESTRLQVWCNGRKFTAGIAMYAQAEGFEAVAHMLMNADENCLITVHGDGLLPERARTMVSTPATEELAV